MVHFDLAQEMKKGRVAIKKILEEKNLDKVLDQEVVVKGWARSVRVSKKFSFVVLNDGSCQDSLQIVVDANLPQYEKISSALMGYALSFRGKIVKSQGKGQGLEMQALEGEVIGSVDESYPLQKKSTSLEFLREITHLRMRTNTFGAVFRLRHALTLATHQFFSERGFFNVHTPIISAIDAEGAGEMFAVTAFDLLKPPLKVDKKIDYDKDFFARPAYLTVTGQLQGECSAMGLGAIYTFGPTFRAENSNTTRHACEFWMIEPEVAFADLEEVAELAADYVKYLINYSFDHCPKEMEFLATREGGPGAVHLENLKKVASSPFAKITYTEAVEILKNSNKKFEFSCAWGDELQTEHERFLAEEHFLGPVIVTDYPKHFKAFYMKQNDDGKTVRAMDLLVPGIGELIGGSQREHDYDKLKNRIKELNMHEDSLWWYLDLRKYGSVPHGGFGLGFERALMYISSMSNIRDVLPFPRTPRHCDI